MRKARGTLSAGLALVLSAASAAFAADAAGLPEAFPSSAAVQAACGRLAAAAYRAEEPAAVALDSEEAAALYAAMEEARPGVVRPMREPEAPPPPGTPAAQGAAASRTRSAQDLGITGIWRVASGPRMGTRDRRKPDFKGQRNSRSTVGRCYAARLSLGYRFVAASETRVWGQAPRFTRAAGPSSAEQRQAR